LNTDTPPTSPSLNRTNFGKRKTSVGSSSSRTSSGDDSHIHKVTYVSDITIQKVNIQPSPKNSTFKIMSVSGNICPRCSKIVYLAEEVKAVGKSFHKRCYNCANCKGSINGGRYSEHNGEVYDNNCYQRLFGPKGILSISN